jgi:putative endonuclease
MFYVYVLQSKVDESIYVGYTNDLRRRLTEHNTGKNISTKRGAPYNLVYYEAFRNSDDAKNREKHLKLYGRTLRELKKRIARSFAS